MEGPSRVMRPTFTAESALEHATRSYIRLGLGNSAGIGEIAPAQVAVSSVSGIYAGIVCVGHTQCVITVDVDEHGHVTQSHCVDEIGSC